MIEPTVGRIVHYYRNGDKGAPVPNYHEGPCAALVTEVHSDRMVNLAVFDWNGNPHSVTSITLVQPDDELPAPGEHYCTWMPYQIKGKATGSESGEKEAGTQSI